MQYPTKLVANQTVGLLSGTKLRPVTATIAIAALSSHSLPMELRAVLKEHCRQVAWLPKTWYIRRIFFLPFLLSLQQVSINSGRYIKEIVKSSCLV